MPLPILPPDLAPNFPEDDGFTGRFIARGRRLRAGEWRLLILALLDDQPRHGYEVIRALDQRSHGVYVPSPGVVYPTLTRVAADGHATIERDGLRKRYHLTPAGSALLRANRAAADRLFAELERIGRRLQQLRGAFPPAPPSAAADAEAAARASGVALARRELDAALAGSHDRPAEEQRRIAAILGRAAAEILGGRP